MTVPARARARARTRALVCEAEGELFQEAVLRKLVVENRYLRIELL